VHWEILHSDNLSRNLTETFKERRIDYNSHPRPKDRAIRPSDCDRIVHFDDLFQRTKWREMAMTLIPCALYKVPVSPYVEIMWVGPSV
jgi:hypothetical protein